MVDQSKEKAKGTAMEEDSMLSLEKHLEGMTLQGEEEDLDLSGEFEEVVKEVRWLALFRVHTTKPAALFGALRNAWAAKEVTFKALGPNLFLVQLRSEMKSNPCMGNSKRRNAWVATSIQE